MVWFFMMLNLMAFWSETRVSAENVISYRPLLSMIADLCQITDLKLKALATQALKYFSFHTHFSLTFHLQPLKINLVNIHLYSYCRAWGISWPKKLFNIGKTILENKWFFPKHIFLPCTDSDGPQHNCMDLEVTDGCHCIYKLATFSLLCL